MTDRDKILLLKVRLRKLESSAKNVDSPGVMQKLRRQIRNLEK